MASRSGSPSVATPPFKRRKYSPSSYSSPHGHDSSPSTRSEKRSPGWKIFTRGLRPFPTGVRVRDLGLIQNPKSKHESIPSEKIEKRGGDGATWVVVDSEDDYKEVDVDGPGGHTNVKTEHHSSHLETDDKSMEKLVNFLRDLDENFEAIESDLVNARGILQAVISSSSPSEPAVKTNHKRKAEELEEE